MPLATLDSSSTVVPFFWRTPGDGEERGFVRKWPTFHGLDRYKQAPTCTKFSSVVQWHRVPGSVGLESDFISLPLSSAASTAASSTLPDQFTRQLGRLRRESKRTRTARRIHTLPHPGGP